MFNFYDYNPVSKLGYQYLSKNNNTWKDCPIHEAASYANYGYKVRVIDNR